MDFVGFFAGNHRIQGWREVAAGWVTWIVIVPVVWVLLALILKAYLESRALRTGRGEELYRGPARTRMALLVGFLGCTATLPIVWYASRDFRNVIALEGLGKGVVAAWIVYLVAGLATFALRYRDHMPWKAVR